MPDHGIQLVRLEAPSVDGGVTCVDGATSCKKGLLTKSKAIVLVVVELARVDMRANRDSVRKGNWSQLLLNCNIWKTNMDDMNTDNLFLLSLHCNIWKGKIDYL